MLKLNFYDLIKSRRSVRKYTSEPIPQDALERILEAARLAPTAANRQPIQLLVIKDPKKHLKKIVRQEWVLGAPIVIIAFVNKEEAWTRSWDNVNFGFVDTTIVMDHLILAASFEGLGTCWIAANDPNEFKGFFSTDESFYFVALTPLGYPADEPREKKRKDLDKIVRILT